MIKSNIRVFEIIEEQRKIVDAMVDNNQIHRYIRKDEFNILADELKTILEGVISMKRNILKKLTPLSEKALDLALQDGWIQTGYNLYKRKETVGDGVYTSSLTFSHDRQGLILMYRKQAKKELADGEES
jgi:hypothetical protein